MNGGSETVTAGQHNIALSLSLDVTKERIFVSWGCGVFDHRERAYGRLGNSLAAVAARDLQSACRFWRVTPRSQTVTTDDLRECIQ
jgi:hypothetical protein